MATIIPTPEAVALAAGILTQSRGDLPLARRTAAEATSWLQSIDPSYKPEPVQTADQRADQLRGEDGWLDYDTADLIRKLEAAERKAAERDDLLTQRNDWQERSRNFCRERDEARQERDRLQEKAADCQNWQDRALRAERTLDGRKPATATPAPAPAAPAPAPVAPVATAPAADPYAGLPPKMRAFLASQKTGLEID